MSGVPRCSVDPPTAVGEPVVFEGTSEARSRCEGALEAHGVPLPLRQRSEWHAAHGSDSFLVAIPDGNGTWRYGVTLDSRPTRSMPGHHIWTALKMRAPADLRFFEAALALLADRATRTPRVLRVDLQCFGLGALEIERMRGPLEKSAFEPSRTFASYRDTLIIDLRRSEEAIFAGFSKKTRRECRLIDRAPVEIRDVSDDRYDARMTDLVRETWARSGEPEEFADWRALRRICAEDDARGRLLGLFRTDDLRPEGLLAIAFAEHHGDHASYSIAASTRDSDLKLPLAYGLLWELTRWARRRGAGWLDLGGIEYAGEGVAPRLSGISRFKRYFSKSMERVGDEWSFAPHPGRERVAHWVTDAANRLRALRKEQSL